MVLPRGITNATLAGNLTTGGTFSSTVQVFNRNYSFYPKPEIARQLLRLSKVGISPALFSTTPDPAPTIKLSPPRFGLAFAKRQAILQNGGIKAEARAAVASTPPTVRIDMHSAAKLVRIENRQSAVAAVHGRAPHSRMPQFIGRTSARSLATSAAGAGGSA